MVSSRRRSICGSVVMAAAIVCTSSMISINGYSFVANRNQIQHQVYSNKSFIETSTTSHRRRHISSASLVMKRPNRRRRSNDNTQQILQQPISEELPANLKRRITASRPTLGHIVPKNSKTRQYKADDQQQSQQGGSNTS